MMKSMTSHAQAQMPITLGHVFPDEKMYEFHKTKLPARTSICKHWKDVLLIWVSRSLNQALARFTNQSSHA